MNAKKDAKIPRTIPMGLFIWILGGFTTVLLGLSGWTLSTVLDNRGEVTKNGQRLENVTTLATEIANTANGNALVLVALKTIHRNDLNIPIVSADPPPRVRCFPRSQL